MILIAVACTAATVTCSADADVTSVTVPDRPAVTVTSIDPAPASATATVDIGALLGLEGSVGRGRRATDRKPGGRGARCNRRHHAAHRRPPRRTHCRLAGPNRWSDLDRSARRRVDDRPRHRRVRRGGCDGVGAERHVRTGRRPTIPRRRSARCRVDRTRPLRRPAARHAGGHRWRAPRRARRADRPLRPRRARRCDRGIAGRGRRRRRRVHHPDRGRPGRRDRGRGADARRRRRRWCPRRRTDAVERRIGSSARGFRPRRATDRRIRSHRDGQSLEEPVGRRPNRPERRGRGDRRPDPAHRWDTRVLPSRRRAGSNSSLPHRATRHTASVPETSTSASSPMPTATDASTSCSPRRIETRWRGHTRRRIVERDTRGRTGLARGPGEQQRVCTPGRRRCPGLRGRHGRRPHRRVAGRSAT